MEITAERWNTVVRNCLQEVALDDARIVGDQIDQIISAVRDGRTTTYAKVGGRPNDWLEAAKFLVEMATFVKVSIETYTLLRAELKRPPTPQEIDHKQDLETTTLQSNDRRRVLEHIVKLLGG